MSQNFQTGRRFHLRLKRSDTRGRQSCGDRSTLERTRVPVALSELIEAELSVLPGVLTKIRREEDIMDLGKGALLWLLGVPLARRV